MSKSLEDIDCVVVGAGAAGLMGAMILARASRNVVVFDAGEQSNLSSRMAHGVFTRDYTPPNELYAMARKQLLQYPTSSIKNDCVLSIKKSANCFLVQTASGVCIQSRAVLFAQGMSYILPPTPRVSLLWGVKAWHCPYCDGFEARNKKLIALGSSAWITQMCILLPQWSKDISWSSTDISLSQEVLERIKVAGGSVISHIIEVRDFESGIDVVLESGDVLHADAMVIETVLKHRDKIAQSLGCTVDEEDRIVADKFGKTSINGIFVAGDQMNSTAQVNIAAASGHFAGLGINLYLAEMDRHSEIQLGL